MSYDLQDPSKFHTEAEKARNAAKIKALPLRDRTYFSLLIATGARATEGLNVTKRDLNPEAQTVRIKGIKGSKTRTIPLPAGLFNDLWSLCESSPDGKAFNVGYSMMQKTWYKISDKKLHALRHDFAVALYRKTKNIRLVQLALGHVELENTLVYAHLVDGEDQLRQALL